MWSKQKPTTDGYYWVKARGQLTGRVYIHPVKVSNDGKTVFSDGGNFSINCLMSGGQFQFKNQLFNLR